MTISHIHLFRASLYAAICLATVGLWMGEDNPWPYPWLVILCAVAAYAFTDIWEMVMIPPALAPWLGAAAVAFFVREELALYKVDPVLPLGHLIIFFQIILLFHQKSQRTYWLLLLTSFLQMLIAALHNNRVAFGLLMCAFLALIVWTMTQFLLVRESERLPTLEVRKRQRPALRRFVAGSLGSAMVIFMAALLLFLVIPRRGQTAWTQAAHRPGQYLSGFDERIRLGQLGTILESDEEVMTVRMFDELGQPYRPREEPYWRGVALTEYENGRWLRKVELEPQRSPWGEAPERYVRQEIRVQGVHRDVLFGLWPAFRGSTRSGQPLGRIGLDGSLVRPEEAPPGPLQYTVDSALDGRDRLRGRHSPRFMYSNEVVRMELTQVPESIAGPLRQYASQLNLPADDPVSLCRALLDHLQDPNIFDYTLQASVDDPSIDPVLDFLINRKEGHCEYFASALALLLRVNGVQVRVVNGFKGGDWNELFGPSMVVRQKHAHSWVEALLVTPDQPDPHWVVLDPTPGQSRERVVAMVSTTPSLLRQVNDISRQIWSNYVLNFNSSEQEAAVYGPIRRLARDQGRRIVGWVQQHWASPPRGFNWIAAVLASVGMLALIFVLRLTVRVLTSRLVLWENGRPRRLGLLGRLLGRFRNMLARWSIVVPAERPRVGFYDRMLRTLEARGWHKSPSSTAHHFAEHTQIEMERLPQAASAARIPLELVDRYYRVRFGQEPLNASDSETIRRLLTQLEEALAKP